MTEDVECSGRERVNRETWEYFNTGCEGPTVRRAGDECPAEAHKNNSVKPIYELWGCFFYNVIRPHGDFLHQYLLAFLNKFFKRKKIPKLSSKLSNE